MRAALDRYKRGRRTRLPDRVLVHLVAARYGQAPESVREWSAQDYLDAVNLLEVTGGGL